MATVLQGQVFSCDFGAERGVELAGPRLAVVVSRNDFNRESSSVLVVPTTRGDIDPLYIDYYPYLEQLDTRASCRNIRLIKADRLGRLEGVATAKQMGQVVRGGLFPYLRDGVLQSHSDHWEFAPGHVHRGLIPNHRGEIEESCFLVLACNEGNGFATVSKVDQSDVGESALRVALTSVAGRGGLTAYSHGIQGIDLEVSVEASDGHSHVGTVDPPSVVKVARGLARLVRLPGHE